MRIYDLRAGDADASRWASASVEWENTPRPPQRIEFSARGDLAGSLEPAPEAFVLAAAFAAARAGERRLRIEDSLCPVFARNVREGLVLLDAWYGGSRSAMSIEASRGFRARPPGAPAAAMFLSGGVDSLHVLRRNRLAFPRSHPESIRIAVHARAFGYSGEANTEAARNIAERASRSIGEIARAEGLRVASVEFDARLLEPDFEFFVLESHGSMLAAAAHLFPGAFRSVAIAASADLRRHFRPWGSHPLLDPLYGSSALTVRHSGHEFSRIEKVRDLSRWDVALATLLVCNEAPLPAGVANCGRCEKCLRTLCELFASGVLDRASTFAVREVTTEAIRRLHTVDAPGLRFHNREGQYPPSWSDLLRELSGRPDLVAAIREWLAKLRQSTNWEADRGWKGGLRRLDRALLGGRLLALRRRRTKTP
ncbi:MAG: hypothetical protein ACRD16_00610 [Thermoanaerobaculia bacterium]